MPLLLLTRSVTETVRSHHHSYRCEMVHRRYEKLSRVAVLKLRRTILTPERMAKSRRCCWRRSLTYRRVPTDGKKRHRERRRHCVGSTVLSASGWSIEIRRNTFWALEKTRFHRINRGAVSKSRLCRFPVKLRNSGSSENAEVVHATEEGPSVLV